MAITKLHIKFFIEIIPWDFESYYHEHLKAGLDKKRRRYPDPFFGSFSEPLTVIDVNGRIVLWYLPGLLPSELQVYLYVKFSDETSYLFETV